MTGRPQDSLAAALRHLRRRAGDPSTRTIAKAISFSHTTIAQALSGARCPSWAVIEGIVLYLEGEIEEFRPLWLAAREAEDPLPPLAVTSGTSSRGGSNVGSEWAAGLPAVGKFAGRAFVSYVREDSAEVDRLQQMLEAAGIPVWRDVSALWPGEDWRAMIREAITDGALVFIACFSSRSVARQKSYQNEELQLAVEQLRLRQPNGSWLFPVRFDDCAVPDFELGAGRTLGSIQWVDLFGASREVEAIRLVMAVLRLLGQSAQDARQASEVAASVIGEQELDAPPEPASGRASARRAERAGTPASPAGRYRGRAVVLCALDLEFLAVRAHLTDTRVVEHPRGTRFEAGDLPGAGWQVAMASIGWGNVGAGVITERAISLFDPDVLLSVGVAGSLRDNVSLGDIVVATRVDTYSGGMVAEDFLARPRTWPVPYRLEQLARKLALDGGWRSLLPEQQGGDLPVVHFRPIAAGEVLLRDAALFAQLRLHNNDAAAIELGSAGIAQAAHLNDVPALVIRGISDLADGTKLDRGWPQRASANAAAFAVCLLTNLNPHSRLARP